MGAATGGDRVSAEGKTGVRRQCAVCSRSGRIASGITLRRLRGGASEALVPECRRCPPATVGALSGGTVAGETRRKGVQYSLFKREGSILPDMGVFYPLLPFGYSSPVTEQLKLALRGKVNFAACLTLGCSFYPTKKSKISLRGPLLHLPKCGTNATFLLRVCFSHSHNRADNGTNRTSLVLPHRKHFRWGPRSGEEGDSPRTTPVSV